ncbi:MAG: metallophosphoesterase [Candidatus Alcyoniella australis]|nr:metallophosphoesterase [Candidatus Alcyoniella australis]
MNSHRLHALPILLLLLLSLLIVASCSTDSDDDDDDSVNDDDDDDDDDIGDDDADDDDDDDDDPPPDPLDCPAVLVRQPYLQLGTTTGMSVLWRSDETGDSLVEYGTTADLGKFVYDENWVTKHELAITGLEPNTTYYYRARTCLDQTSVDSFRTAPTSADPLNFVAFGDNQSGYETFTEIASLMEMEDPYMAISVGDIVDDGWVEEDYDQQVFTPAQSLWRSTPFFVSIGNHEGGSPLFQDNFRFPGDGKLYYSFTYGNVFFLCLEQDTWHFTFPGTQQYEFMVAALSSEEAQNAEFRVVFFHTPPWCEGWEGYEGEKLIRLFIVPQMENYNVDVYFNGHTHDYERGLRNGVASYIIGGAGGGLDSWARDVEHISVYEATHHFMSVHVADQTMTLDAINLDGEVFDTYQIIH